MRYTISPTTFPCVEISLNPGEQIYSERGSMIWMDDGIKMDTTTGGGILKGIARKFSGDSFFQNKFIALRPDAKVTFGTSFIGNIKALEVSPNREYICQKGSFLVADQSVSLNVTLTRKISSGFFGGEGFILQRMSGQGIALIETKGSLVEKQLAPGEVLFVDNGAIAYFDASVRYEVTMVKGGKNLLFGGEGLTLIRLVGPGTVGLQTSNLQDVAAALLPYLPMQSSNSGGASFNIG